jgi:hypothetical protein
MTPEVLQRINELRSKALRGEELSLQENIEVVKLIRQNRRSAAEATKASKSKAKPIDPSALQGLLDGLLK